jgi:hypothetical protein
MSEKLSVGLMGISAEGTASTIFVMVLIGGGLVAAFFMGKLSSILDVCFGLRPF